MLLELTKEEKLIIISCLNERYDQYFQSINKTSNDNVDNEKMKKETMKRMDIINVIFSKLDYKRFPDRD